MNTRMIAATLSLSALLVSGAASADATPHDAYYAAFYGMGSTMTPPSGEVLTPMKGKAGYGLPNDGDTRYSKAIQGGNSRNMMNPHGALPAGGVLEPAPWGHRIYDAAFNPS